MELKINLPYSMWEYKLSGVYKIEFDDGCFYIGASKHLRSRAASWAELMQAKNKITTKHTGAAMVERIKKGGSAILEIVELCHQKDLKDKESFYLDKYKDDLKMLSSNDNGAWKAVLQYKEDGIFIKKHFSIQGAARYMGSNLSSVQRVLSGERKSHKGMVFVYEHDYHKRRQEIIKSRYIKSPRKNGRNILLVDSSGKVLKKFNKITEAANEARCDRKTIVRVLAGHQKAAKGFLFVYEPK